MSTEIKGHEVFRDKDKRGAERYVTVVSTLQIGNQMYARVVGCQRDGKPLYYQGRTTRIRFDTLQKRFERMG